MPVHGDIDHDRMDRQKVFSRWEKYGPNLYEQVITISQLLSGVPTHYILYIAVYRPVYPVRHILREQRWEKQHDVVMYQGEQSRVTVLIQMSLQYRDEVASEAAHQRMAWRRLVLYTPYTHVQAVVSTGLRRVLVSWCFLD